MFYFETKHYKYPCLNQNNMQKLDKSIKYVEKIIHVTNTVLTRTIVNDD